MRPTWAHGTSERGDAVFPLPSSEAITTAATGVDPAANPNTAAISATAWPGRLTAVDHATRAPSARAGALGRCTFRAAEG